MTTPLEAMRKALDALLCVVSQIKCPPMEVDGAIADLRAAIAALESAEPIGYVDPDENYDGSVIRTVQRFGAVPVYLHPKAEPLTEARILSLMPESIPTKYDGSLFHFAKAIEKEVQG